MNPIQLDNKWRIEAETYSWKLTSSEEAEKEEVIRKGKKFIKTGKMVPYQEEKDWYFPTIKMCLDKYLQETFKSDKNISDMVERLTAIESKIDEVKGIFKKQ